MSTTRSNTGSLPKGSRNERLANMARGLPASGINPKSSRGSVPEAEQQQLEEAGESAIQLPSNIQLPSKIAQEVEGIAPQPQPMADADHIQNVCDAATLPLHQEMIHMREKVGELNQPKQQEGNGPQMEALMDAIKSLGDVKHLIDEVSILRQDTNYLLENQSNKSIHENVAMDEPNNSQVKPEVQRLVVVKEENDSGRNTRVKNEPKLEGKTFKIKDNQIIMVDSDEDSIDYGTEVDITASYTFAKKYNFLMKFASYNADEFATDTSKLWVQVATKF